MEPSSIQLNVLVLMFGIGFLGVLAHWAKSAWYKQAPWNLFAYLFTDKPGASGTAFVAYCTGFWLLHTAGTYDLVKWEYIMSAWDNGVLFEPFQSALIQTIMAGYIADSGWNKAGAPLKDRRAKYVEGK